MKALLILGGIAIAALVYLLRVIKKGAYKE